MSRSGWSSAMLVVALAAVLAGCAVVRPDAARAHAAVPRLDGLALNESVTSAQLAASPHHFDCRAQSQSGRFEFCWPKSTDAQASVVMLLDGRVAGIMRTFKPGSEETAVQWSLSFMGNPTSRKSLHGQTDLLWDDKKDPFARLLTHLAQFEGETAFVVMTRQLERFLDEQNALPQNSPEDTRDRNRMTPGRCLAMPLLCPAA